MIWWFFIPIFNISSSAKEVIRLKIEVTQRFRDKEADLETKEAGETMEVRKERAEYLISNGFAKMVTPPKKGEETAG